MPAKPPDAPAIAQPKVRTESTLIPDNFAISGEYADARSANPIFVFWNNRVKSSIATATKTKTNRL